jgi:hypothetical protein
LDWLTARGIVAKAPEVEGVTGKYFVAFAEGKPASAASDHDIQNKLWKLSENLVRPFLVKKV